MSGEWSRFEFKVMCDIEEDRGAQDRFFNELQEVMLKHCSLWFKVTEVKKDGRDYTVSDFYGTDYKNATEGGKKCQRGLSGR